LTALPTVPASTALAGLSELRFDGRRLAGVQAPALPENSLLGAATGITGAMTSASLNPPCDGNLMHNGIVA